MNFPKELRYSKDHEWVSKSDSNGLVTIGITDFAQRELGDIVFVEAETLNETMDAEEIFGSIEAVKTVSDLIMPISGEIIELNPKLKDEPELINTDPYGNGWIIKVKMTNDNPNLLSVEDYKKIINES